MDWDNLLGEYQGRSPSPQKRNNMNWLSSLFTGAGGILGTILQNTFNSRQVAETNRANRELVDRQNEFARQESELAYKRSLPQNQVANLMNAGMSRAGAINTLNGGGSYQPAPISTAQDEAPQIDLSQAINAMQASAQLAEQKRQFNINASIERDKANLERSRFEYEKERNKVNDGYDNIIKTFQAAKIQSESMSANLDWIVKEFTQDERLDAERQKLLAEKAKAVSEGLQAELMKGALKDVDPETLKTLFKYQAMLEMVGNIGHMSLDKAIGIIHDIKEIFVPG